MDYYHILRSNNISQQRVTETPCSACWWPILTSVFAAVTVNALMKYLTLTRRYQTIERVVNGTFSMQKEWMLSTGMPWDEEEVKSTFDHFLLYRVRVITQDVMEMDAVLSSF